MENSAPAPQESKPSKTGPLVKALQEKRIFELSDQGELEKCIRYCMLLVGIRANNLPGKEETSVLFAHILKNYSGHTISEIRLAFEKAISGKLDISPDDVKAYENFTAAYFSAIVNSYRRWAQAEYRQNLTAFEPPPATKIYTQEENDDIARGDVERQYQLFLKGFELKTPQFNRVILHKDGLIGEMETTVEFFHRMAGKGQLHIYEKK
jgi:hypothetical protein